MQATVRVYKVCGADSCPSRGLRCSQMSDPKSETQTTVQIEICNADNCSSRGLRGAGNCPNRNLRGADSCSSRGLRCRQLSNSRSARCRQLFESRSAVQTAVRVEVCGADNYKVCDADNCVARFKICVMCSAGFDACVRGTRCVRGSVSACMKTCQASHSICYPQAQTPYSADRVHCPPRKHRSYYKC